MRTEHGGAAVLEDVANRVEARVDSRRVLNFTLGDRHVEIASHEHLLVLKLEARDRYDRHRWVRARAGPRRTRQCPRAGSSSPIRCRTTKILSPAACRRPWSTARRKSTNADCRLYRPRQAAPRCIRGYLLTGRLPPPSLRR